jgi:hypothetical protein
MMTARLRPHPCYGRSNLRPPELSTAGRLAADHVKTGAGVSKCELGPVPTPCPERSALWYVVMKFQTKTPRKTIASRNSNHLSIDITVNQYLLVKVAIQHTRFIPRRSATSPTSASSRPIARV